MNPSEYLSDIEQEKISAFNADPILKEAIKKTLLAGIYSNGVLKPGQPAEPRKNWALSFGAIERHVSDEEIGQNVRAYAWGINAIEAAFQKLDDIKVEPRKEDKKKKNPAL